MRIAGVSVVSELNTLTLRNPYSEVGKIMAEIMDVAPVGEKGQVTIPRQVRDLLELKPGDRIAFVNKDNEIVLRKSKMKRLSEILSRGKPLPESSILFQRKLRKEWK